MEYLPLQFFKSCIIRRKLSIVFKPAAIDPDILSPCFGNLLRIPFYDLLNTFFHLVVVHVRHQIWRALCIVNQQRPIFSDIPQHTPHINICMDITLRNTERVMNTAVINIITGIHNRDTFCTAHQSIHLILSFFLEM